MDKEKVLIVDDILINREILAEILKEEFEILQAENGFDAVDIMINNSESIAMVLLDIMMPEMDGFEVLEVMRSCRLEGKIPVILISAAGSDENQIRGLTLGSADFVTKPFHPEIVKRRVYSHIELRRHRVHLEKLVKESVDELLSMRDSMIDMLASVIEHRYVESGHHVKRTKNLAEMLMLLVKKSGKMDSVITGENLDLIGKAVPLHDIGKISTADYILLKPGKLSEGEFEKVKDHTTVGASMIDSMADTNDEQYARYCREICLYHHEKWDGSGYPHGLFQNEIPFSARVMAIVDVYDALTAERIYKPKFTHDFAISVMQNESGRHFDPVLLDIFLTNHAVFENMG